MKHWATKRISSAAAFFRLKVKNAYHVEAPAKWNRLISARQRVLYYRFSIRKSRSPRQCSSQYGLILIWLKNASTSYNISKSFIIERKGFLNNLSIYLSYREWRHFLFPKPNKSRICIDIYRLPRNIIIFECRKYLFMSPAWKIYKENNYCNKAMKSKYLK